MSWIHAHLLTTIIFLPLFAMVMILFVPATRVREIRFLSLLTSLVTFALSMVAWNRVTGSGAFELTELVSWIPSLGISYRLGVDGVGMILILLSAFLLPLIILSAWNEIEKSCKLFYMLLLLLSTGMMGVFAALDLFLFYIFWELVLIPMYFLVGVWGSGNRIRVAFKFLLYTAWYCGGTFDLIAWYEKGFPVTAQLWLFGAFALAFAIKVPLFPFHTWLPDTHTEAPTAGSVILAGVLLKMGTYGFYRFAIPLFPLAVVKFAPLMLTLSVIGIIYGALVAMIQPDIKRLVAYSSVSHLGFVMLGLFALEPHAVSGAVLQMVNHGLSTGALFFLIGMLYHRRHTRLIADYGGIAKVVPLFAAVFLFISFASVGMPGLNNFVGEFLILLGAFQTKTWYASFAVIGVIL